MCERDTPVPTGSTFAYAVGHATQDSSMTEANATRTATAASAFGRPGRAAGLIMEVGVRAWRGSVEPSNGRALAMSFAGAVGLLLSLAGMGSAWGALGDARALSTGGRAPAVIQASGVGRGCGGDPGAYQAVVRYSYEVGGVVRIGERASLDGAECGSERWARGAAARRPVDSHAVARYDPVRVSQSALSVGESTWAAWLGVLATAPLAAACALWSGRGLRALLSNGSEH